MAAFKGTSGADSFVAADGDNSYDGLGGTDTITFNFKLTDATVGFAGNKVIFDTATSHTVLTGFQIYRFTDGTVDETAGSGLVSALYYYSQYHDVWATHESAEAHYMSSGWKEGRNPNAFFDTNYYLDANHDVKSAGVNPLTQFDTVGWTEGRDPSPNFSVAGYLAQNPDVAAAHVDPLKQFLHSGVEEGREPVSVASFASTEMVNLSDPMGAPGGGAPSSSGGGAAITGSVQTTGIAPNGFDYAFYLSHNHDVATAGVDPFQHFEVNGWKEGRDPNGYFDTKGYLAQYGDVKAAGINPLDHFHNNGWTEGRDPSPWFSVAKYLAANPDVAAAHVDPLEHFLEHGQFEGRQAIAEDVVDASAQANSVAVGAAVGTFTGVDASWGGWTNATYSIISDGSNGGFAVNPTTGVVSVANSSKVGANGTFGVTVQATDDGHTGIKQFSIQVGTGETNNANDSAPVAVNDSFSVNEDAALSGANVLANDTDIDVGDGKSVVNFTVNGTTHSAGNAIALGNGATLNVSSSGAVTLSQNGAYEGLRDGDVANIGFSYTMQDNAGAQATAGVSLTVNGINDAPTLDLDNATAGNDFSTTETSGGSTVVAHNPAITDGAANAEGKIASIALHLSAVSGSTNTGEGLHLPASIESALTTLGIATVTGEGTSDLTITATTFFTPAVAQSIIAQFTHADPDTDFSFNPQDRSISVTVTDLNANANPNAFVTQTASIDMAADVTDTTNIGHFTGANLADTIRGGTVDETMTGGGGNDSIFGGTGHNAAVFTGNQADYTVTPISAGVYTVADSVANRDGTDTVHNVQTLHFNGNNADMQLGVQLFDHGGQLIATFDHIQDAVAAADNSGETILVGSGTYNETVQIGSGKDGLTIVGANHGIDGTGVRGAESAITGGLQVNASNVTIDGVDLAGAHQFSGPPWPVGFYILGNNVTLENSVIDGTGIGGDPLPGTTDPSITGLSITHNWVKEWTGGGIYVSGNGQGSIDHNTFDHNGNGVVTESTHATISANHFNNSVGSQVASVGSDPVENVGSFVTSDNTFTGASQPVSIYPNASGAQDITGTVFDDKFKGRDNDGDHGTSHGPFTFSGGDGNDIYYVNNTDTVIEQANQGADDVRSTSSYTLSANVENLTLLDGPSDTETFETMALGPITNGENGWQVAGSHDQEVVASGLGSGQAFRMSSDPASGDFGGPYSPSLTAAAGEPSTSATYDGQYVRFDFKPVSATADGSRLEVDLGKSDGTDRENFMIIENVGGGIRIAVASPANLTGDFGPPGAFPNDWNTLVSDVDPTVAHQLDMQVVYQDGPNNDVINIYLDGQFIGTTTTFENYHDFSSDNAPNQPHDVNAEANQSNRVFFRAGDNGQPQDGSGVGQNQGFFFDNINYGVGAVNGTGNDLNNVITGNSGDNTLIGMGGDDTLNGGAGIDTAAYQDARSNYAVTTTSNTHGLVTSFSLVQETGAPGAVAEGTDTLTSIERLQFSDVTLDLAQKVQLFDGSGHLVGTFGTIHDALTAAHDGNTIRLAAGAYDESFDIGKHVAILGANSGIAGTGSRGPESVIRGQVTVSAATGGSVVINGVEVYNTSDNTHSFVGIQVNSGTDITVSNSVFYSPVANGNNTGTPDKAIFLPTSATGTIDIDHNLFTGGSHNAFSTASWTTGIWSDGTQASATVDHNTFEYVRTGINSDDFHTNFAITNNTFQNSGSGVSIGGAAGGANADVANITSIHDNTFNNVDTDFNLQNITAAGKTIGFDLTAINNQTSGTSSGTVLAGANGDTIKGSVGNDILVGNGGNDTLTGGDGSDVIQGSAGTDTVDYSHDGGSGAVNVNLTTGFATDSFGKTDTLISIENAIGTSGADTFTSALTGVNTFTGGDGNDTYNVKTGDVIVELNGNAGGIDQVNATGSYTLEASVENLTLVDTSVSNTQTFDGMPVGPITNGENGTNLSDTAGTNGAGWEVLSTHDQGIVDLGGGNHVFRMSSDPASGDFGGPYSPQLSAAAGEPDTGAAFSSQSIAFDFQAANALNPSDGSRLEVDFGNAAGTDRNNFLVIESFAGGIRIAVSEPDLTGNFSGSGSPAPNDDRELISGVDPTVQHHLEMRLDYVDGANNDIINIYLDSQYIGQTTTFENYHDSINGVANHVANATANLTDRVFFRGGLNGQPQDGPGGQDQGFYFDNVSTSVYNNTSGTGNDLANVITGNSGDNTLEGLGGNDTLFGGAGSDTINGGVNDFAVTPAAANDILWGGTGTGFDGAADTFQFEGRFSSFSVDNGVDTVMDFEQAVDTLVFAGYASHSGSMIIAQQASDVLITVDDGSVASGVLVKNASAAYLAAHIEVGPAGHLNDILIH